MHLCNLKKVHLSIHTRVILLQMKQREMKCKKDESGNENILLLHLVSSERLKTAREDVVQVAAVMTTVEQNIGQVGVALALPLDLGLLLDLELLLPSRRHHHPEARRINSTREDELNSAAQSMTIVVVEMLAIIEMTEEAGKIIAVIGYPVVVEAVIAVEGLLPADNRIAIVAALAVGTAIAGTAMNAIQSVVDMIVIVIK